MIALFSWGTSSKEKKFLSIFLIQVSAYEACDRTRTPLHTLKILERCKRKHALFDSKSFKVCGKSHVENKSVFYFSLSIKHKDLTRESCVFIFYFIGSLVKIGVPKVRLRIRVRIRAGGNFPRTVKIVAMFLFSLRKGRQTSKELKKYMNDGTIVFLMSSATCGVL